MSRRLPGLVLVGTGAFVFASSFAFASAPQWKSLPDSPAKLAAAIDQQLAAMRNSEGMSALAAASPITRKASCRAHILVESPKRYRLEYALFGPNGSSLTKETAIGNDKYYATLSALGVGKSKPLGSRNVLKPTILTDWLFDGSRAILASIGSDDRPLTMLVKAATGAGITVTVQGRDWVESGKNVSQRRLLFERPAALAKKFGELRYEVWVSTGSLRPLYLGNFYTSPDQKRTRVECQYQWRHVPSIPKETFAIPKPSAPTKS